MAQQNPSIAQPWRLIAIIAEQLSDHPVERPEPKSAFPRLVQGVGYVPGGPADVDAETAQLADDLSALWLGHGPVAGQPALAQRPAEQEVARDLQDRGRLTEPFIDGRFAGR